MALLDTMESILDSLKEALAESSEADKNTEKSRENRFTEYRGSILDYKKELIAHITAQKRSVSSALPMASVTDVKKIRDKMDNLNSQLNQLRKALKDLD